MYGLSTFHEFNPSGQDSSLYMRFIDLITCIIGILMLRSLFTYLATSSLEDIYGKYFKTVTSIDFVNGLAKMRDNPVIMICNFIGNPFT